MSKSVKTMVLFAVAGILSGILSSAEAADKIKEGSAAMIKYSLEADGATIVPQDSPETMELVVGGNKYPPAFEKQLIGLKKGAKKSIVLKPNEAFGPEKPDLVKRIPKSQLPPDFKPVEGSLVAGKNGQSVFRIAKILDDSVVIDQNHPFAGKTLKYNIMVVDVR